MFCLTKCLLRTRPEAGFDYDTWFHSEHAAQARSPGRFQKGQKVSHLVETTCLDPLSQRPFFTQCTHLCTCLLLSSSIARS